MSATARLEFRVTEENRDRIARAAELAREPMTAFARTAAEERAEQVLREHEMTTTVPAEFFDDLLAALDAPTEASPTLVKAATRLRQYVDRS